MMITKIISVASETDAELSAKRCPVTAMPSAKTTMKSPRNSFSQMDSPAAPESINPRWLWLNLF
jgi:hypothetical protein